MTSLKSIWAVVAGFLTVVILSIGTDAILQGTDLFPPQSEPSAYTPSLLLIALLYRTLFTVAGGYVAATLAPAKPLQHAIILGGVGIVAGTMGAIMTWDFTPHHWYPIALVVESVPCTWLGGRLKIKKSDNNRGSQTEVHQ